METWLQPLHEFYLEGDAGCILDLKRHFLPIQRDLSGVERSWGETETGG